jgi:hypothetical protein
MKKTAFIAGALLLLAVARVSAQDQPVTKSPTVDSINAKYKMLEMPKALTIEQIYPVLGQYQLTNNTDKTEVGPVKVVIDETNKGTVWIEGLPQGRVYAQLRKSPATYKIPAQKTVDGNDVAEGTLIYDKDNNLLSVSIGKPYNMASPEAVFSAPAEPEVVVTEVKTKSNKTKIKTEKKPVVKHLVYTGSKEVQTNVMN